MQSWQRSTSAHVLQVNLWPMISFCELQESQTAPHEIDPLGKVLMPCSSRMQADSSSPKKRSFFARWKLDLPSPRLKCFRIEAERAAFFFRGMSSKVKSVLTSSDDSVKESVIAQSMH